MKSNMLNIKSSMNLDGSFIEVEELFSRAAKEGLTHVAITDDGTLHTIGYISEAISKTGVKAVVGCIFPYQVGTNNVKLALYPKNEVGKKQLYELSSRYQINDCKSFGLAKMNGIFENMNIVLDSTNIDSKQVLETIRTLSALVEKKNLFVGISENYLQDKKDKNIHIKEVLIKEKMGYVVFNKVHFLDEEAFDTYSDFLGLKNINKPEIVDGYLLEKEEFESTFDYMDGVEECTNRIINSTRVSYEIKQAKSQIPVFKIKEEFVVNSLFVSRFPNYKNNKSAAYLGTIVIEGVISRYGKDKAAIERALEELRVIIGKGYEDYFLIVWDFVKYAKENDIPVGVRGSVLSSIVAYSLRLTNICPLKHKLQFERFLNEFRTDMPDIDVDVSQMHREKLISYIRRAHGHECVAQLLTRNSWGFKNVVSELLKTHRVPKEKLDLMWSFNPDRYSSLEELTNKNPEVIEVMKNSKDVQMLLSGGYRMMKLPRTTSTHPAGVVISSGPLKNQMPVKKDDAGNLLIQIPNDNNVLEATGHPKMDILGLKKLDTVNIAKKLVEKRTNRPFPEVDFKDVKTFELIRSGNLLGVFQLEASSVSEFAKMMQISSFEELVILNAMNRPGPIDEIPNYVAKKGQPITLTSVTGELLSGVECLYEIIEETRGIFTFQEQINTMVQVWAGYSAAEADLFRRAISKKKNNFLLQEEHKFIERAIKSGRDKETSEKLFELIYKFKDFGFNKGHATGYGELSFITAYLKANFPIEFMTALLMTADSNKFSTYIHEANRMGIKILRPDINESYETFKIAEEGIRCPLYIIKGMGQGTAKQIVEMKKNVPFKDIYDVTKRMEGILDKGILEKMIKSGALDSIGDRGMIFETIRKNELSIVGEEITLIDRALQELEMTGLIFSIGEADIDKIIKDAARKENCVVGIVTNVTPMLDKYKKEMARIKIVDFSGESSNYVIFNQNWKTERNNITERTIIMAHVDDKTRAVKKTMKINT